MAMYPNGRHMSMSPGRHFGAAPGLDVYFRGRGDRLNSFYNGVILPTASSPQGYGIRGIVPAIRPGGLSTALKGVGTVAAAGQLGLNAQATLTGQGGLTALGGLIVNLLATISGTGGISTAALQAFLNALATIGGTGGIAASLGGLGGLTAQATGSGGMQGALTGTGAMSSTIRGYGDLTPEGLRDAVWSAIASGYVDPTTMGGKLNAASAGGVDLNALATAVWAFSARTLTAGAAPTPAANAAAVRAELAAELLRIIELAKLHGLVQGVDLVVSDSSRTAGDVSQSIATSAGATTVSRLP